jgi:NAD+ diphosphatase
VTVGDVRYVASQPWPFPSQLMMACVATAADDTITLDTNELEDAIWVGRDEVRAVLAGAPGSFIAPPPYAIAFTLLTEWAKG